jgi:hypothetical protein
MLAVGLFFCALTIHATLSRIWPRANRMLLFVICGLGVVLAWLGSRLRTGQLDIGDSLSMLLIFAFLCELHLFTLGFSMTSISASLLVRLGRPGLTEDEVQRDYPSQEMINIRLQRLLQAEYIQLQDDVLSVTTKGHRLIRMYQVARRLFRHGTDYRDPTCGQHGL